MSGHELDLGYQWLYSTLSGDSTLASLAPGGVWRSLAPPNTTTPYVIFAFQGGTDTTNSRGERLLDELVYQVKAVGPAATTGAIADAAARVDQLIGNPPASGITINGLGAILASYRETPLAVDELVVGELWCNLGGTYRLLIEQIS